MNFEQAERLSKSVCSDTECCGIDGIADSDLFTDMFSYKQSSSCAKESAYNVCVESGKELCQVFNGTLRKDGFVEAITSDMSIGIVLMVMLGSIIYALFCEYAHRQRVHTRSTESSVQQQQHYSENEEAFRTMLDERHSNKDALRWDLHFVDNKMERAYEFDRCNAHLFRSRCSSIVLLSCSFYYVGTDPSIFLVGFLPSFATFLFTFPPVLTKFVGVGVSLNNNVWFSCQVFFLLALLDLQNSTRKLEIMLLFLVYASINTLHWTMSSSQWFQRLQSSLFVCAAQMYIMYSTKTVGAGIPAIGGREGLLQLGSTGCTSFDEYLGGESDSGVQIASWNAFPAISLIPSFDARVWSSCSQRSTNFSFLKAALFLLLHLAMMVYTQFYHEMEMRLYFVSNFKKKRLD